MLGPMVKSRTTANLLDLLYQINTLLHNVFLLNPQTTSYKAIQELLDQNILTYDIESNSITLLPVSADEKLILIKSETGVFMVNQTENDSDEEQFGTSLLSIVDQPKPLLNEKISIFLDYLFIPYSATNYSKFSFEQKLALYVILSEEYNAMLVQKDITTMALLGQETVLVIINEVYSRIDNHPLLSSISKDNLIILIRKFFFALQQMVRNFFPA